MMLPSSRKVDFCLNRWLDSSIIRNIFNLLNDKDDSRLGFIFISRSFSFLFKFTLPPKALPFRVSTQSPGDLARNPSF